MAIKINGPGESHARSLIASGKINTGSWDFTGEDGDKLLGADGSDWAAYSAMHLAEDTDAADETKAKFKYPYGKSGEVFTAALKAIEGRATQQGLSDLSDCAAKLLAAASPDDKKDAETKSAPATDETVEKRLLDDGDAPTPGDMDGDGDQDEPGEPDADDGPKMRTSRSAMAHARSMVRAGKVSHGPFTFDAADRAAMLGPNGTHISELQRHHLGTDDTEDDPAKKPAYPFGKDGRVYSRAFRSIARRAAVNGYDGIAAAATELMAAATPPDDDGGDEAPATLPTAKKGRAARLHQAHSGLKYRVLPFEVSRTTDDGSYFEGYAAVLNNVDEYNTIMAVGCFDADIDSFRREGFLGGLNHDWDNPIGSPEVVRVDRKGLFIGGHVLDTAHGLDMRKWLRAGTVKKMSFGFDVVEQQWLDEAAEVMAYWDRVGYQPTPQDRERAGKGVMLFTRLRVFEGSPVMVAGNALADITAVRSDPGADADADAGAETPHLTLESHALAVRDAVKDFCDRLVQLAALRASQGRSLARDKTSRLREVRDLIDSAEAACRPKASRSDIAALRRELYDLDISLLTPAATGTPR